MGQASQEQKLEKIYRIFDFQDKGNDFKNISDDDVKRISGYGKKGTMQTQLKKQGFIYDRVSGTFYPETEEAKDILKNRPIAMDITDSITNTITDTEGITERVTNDITEGVTDTDNVIDIIDPLPITKRVTNTITTVDDNRATYIIAEDLTLDRDLVRLLNANKEMIIDKLTKDKKAIEITVNTRDKASQKNLRVFDSVSTDFDKFCDEHKEFKKQELVSQALHEFIENHK